jgi:hypothetical protein
MNNIENEDWRTEEKRKMVAGKFLRSEGDQPSERISDIGDTKYLRLLSIN